MHVAHSTLTRIEIVDQHMLRTIPKFLFDNWFADGAFQGCMKYNIAMAKLQFAICKMKNATACIEFNNLTEFRLFVLCLCVCVRLQFDLGEFTVIYVR